MARSSGEMPFLDHLEELRSRLVKAVVALVAAVGAGIWIVTQFRLVDILQAPITPLLEGRHLVVHSPTEPFMIVLQLGFIVGLVLASPVLIWQLWAFLAPALYDREKRAIVPALFAGFILFVSGAVLSFIFIVPEALRVLLGFKPGTFDLLITYREYFSFVLQVVLAMGISAELPLVIIMLAVLGVVTPVMLHRFRRFAAILAFAGGAILSPGTDIFSMMMMSIPLLILYEVGFAGAWIVHRRRLRAAAAAMVMLVGFGFPTRLDAQRPTPPPRPVTQQNPRQTPADTGARTPTPLDTASARRLGIPTAPKRSFAAPDSIADDLLELEGYDVTRYRSDTARVQTVARVVELDGNAMTERSGSTLEARHINYREGDCRFDAEGEPHLFQEGTVVVGRQVQFNTCLERGLVQDGQTTFPQQGANWIIRGNIAMDSLTSRIYARAQEITSCDLPDSHYHFAAKELKWVNGSVMVARPTVLYIRDVPIAWIPFLFQDTKRGRRSGILIPEFGFNDIVRPSRAYNRTVRNIGYYWAPNDYLDVLGRFDWFSNRYIELGFEGQYRWIDKFARGAVSFSKSSEIGSGSGNSNTRIVWNHSQSFNVTTKLNVSLDYSTNSSIIRRNSIDPRLTTQQIRSSANLNRQFKWGNVAVGWTRSQNVTDGSGSRTEPSLSVSPKPLDFGANVTWSPDLNFNRDVSFRQPLPSVLVPRGIGGQVDTLKVTGGSRVSRFTMNTPLRIGGFQWQNAVSLIDADSAGLREEVVRLLNDDTPDPTDSITVRRVRGGGFGSEFDWQTGINLPIVFRTSWKVTPNVGITNITSGPFAVRNERTDGQFVRQGKRLQFGVSVSPTFYGFFPGIGPLARIRHTIQPSLNYSYSPAANVPIEFARAITPGGQPLVLKSIPSQNLNLTLSQNFEGKSKRPAGDTTDAAVKKIRILSISTSGMSYDFEKAKQPGRTGWGSGSLTNSLLSDLVPGLNLSLSHDLFIGQFDSDTARFNPFLSGVTASFSLTDGTFKSIGRLLGLTTEPPTKETAQPARAPNLPGQSPFGGIDDLRRGTGFTSNQNYARGQRGFNANVNLTIARNRPVGTTAAARVPNRSNLSLNTSFAPTQFWQVSWNTQYDMTNKKFESQQLSLNRDLHDWRATFSFLRSPNGNFQFSFLVTLIDLPDIKFDYRQNTIQSDRR